MKIEYIRAKNFLCIGKEPVEIDFTKLGEVVLISGKNLDFHDEDESLLEYSDSGNEYHSNGSGKCFGKSTPILMYDGTVKKVEDVHIGDLVMGNDSTPRRVLSLGRGREMLYRVTPKKGDPYVVNGSHILTLKTKDKKHNRYKKSRFGSGNNPYVFNISVRDYMKQSKTFKHVMGGYRASVQFPKKHVAIDPYYLGIWLGDGHSKVPCITTIDQQVADCVYAEAARRNLFVRPFLNSKNVPSLSIYSKGCSEEPGAEELYAFDLHQKGSSYDKISKLMAKKYPNHCKRFQGRPSSGSVWRSINKTSKWLSCNPRPLNEDHPSSQFNTLLRDLKDYDLINNKHIPIDYKTNDRQIRLSLLAGLMDSDGHLGRGYFDFVNKNKTLAEDVTYLARSLGFGAVLRQTTKQCQTGAVGHYWCVSILGNCSVIPTRIPRKQSPKRGINKDPLTVGIKVEPIGVGDYYGFQVDGNNLFLLGDFTVVHNSSLSETLVYGLYGNTIRKKMSHADAIHNITKKKLEVEVIFQINGVRYRIVRTRKPDTVKLWQDGPPWVNADEDNSNEITRGGQPTTQKQIEELLGMNHKAFVNVVCFGQHNDYNFLECTAAEQRAIAESLLSLEIYNEYSATAKDDLKDLKTELKDLVSEYEQIKESETRCLDRISQVERQNKDWKVKCEKEINDAKQRLTEIEHEMANSDLGTSLLEYEKAQEEVSDIKDGLPNKQVNETNLEEALQQTKDHQDRVGEKIHELRLEIKSIERDIRDNQKDQDKCKKEIEKLNKLPAGSKCPHCYSVINKQHYKHVVQLHKNKIESLIPKKNALEAKLGLCELEIDKRNASQEKLETLKKVALHKLRIIKTSIQENKSRLTGLAKVQRPDLTAKELVLEEKISQSKQLIETKEQELAEGGPYLMILNNARDDLVAVIGKKKDQKEKIEETEEAIPYHEYWIKAFGDEGIRSFIIEGIVPALNGRTDYWMEHLTNGKMKVSFDEHLNANIESATGDSYAYFATCGGERKRINLAISQAFAHVMMLSSGTWPSIVFLDEVSDSIDQRGIRSIYQMICELSTEKQVFVITHNIHLRQMLDGVDHIVVLRQGGSTKRIK